MKVRDLMKLLAQQDPEREVWVSDVDYASEYRDMVGTRHYRASGLCEEPMIGEDGRHDSSVADVRLVIAHHTLYDEA